MCLYGLCLEEDWKEAEILHRAVEKLLVAVGPLIEAGLLDSALDRAFSILGGRDIGLECAGPYRSMTGQQLEKLRENLLETALEWLEDGISSDWFIYLSEGTTMPRRMMFWQVTKTIKVGKAVRMSEA